MPDDNKPEKEEQEERDWWFALSQTSLAKIWENDEDDIYAELLDKDVRCDDPQP
ncbi:MAG: hypothetical protein BroJett018_45590 [Chloroflexota bacterium]|nr:hypothetical protein [Chloroflexota bacterium]GIK66765.1 MAG: hypothetical protein BroJett018_45590 [Chloroflexota bacterium]